MIRGLKPICRRPTLFNCYNHFKDDLDLVVKYEEVLETWATKVNQLAGTKTYYAQDFFRYNAVIKAGEPEPPGAVCFGLNELGLLFFLSQGHIIQKKKEKLSGLI